MDRIIADLHFHSKYSRAVSQQMELPTIALWAKKKGINLLCTADFTHPLWIREIEALVEETAPGIYQLKNAQQDSTSPMFVIAGEISSIYSQAGRGRRIHNLVLVPNLKAAKKINRALVLQGANLQSDGRPIIGLSSEELVELVLEQSQDCLIIPCHIWTPWFSLYGANSGFDTINQCFGRYQDQIFAVETGLSSDPAMNWQIAELDNRQIVSFSDAHSPAKLGREVTVFSRKKRTAKTPFSFADLGKAIKNQPSSSWEISSTIEFYPEEGKYHFSGHRNCHVKRSPHQIKKRGTTCPVCGKPLTLGVLQRVTQLSKRVITPKKKIEKGIVVNHHPQDSRPPYITLVPLLEIIAEAENTSPAAQKASLLYQTMIEKMGSEFEILIKTPTEKIKSLFGEKIGEGIAKVRKQEITIKPGFDGLFGIVKIWGKEEKESEEKQMGLF